MEEQSSRGSAIVWSNVFEEGPPSAEALGAAISQARASYKVLRWWKYGQPAIDLIRVTLDAGIGDAGQVIQDILKAHGKEIQVNLDVFPYGIPDPEGVRINVALERMVQQ